MTHKFTSLRTFFCDKDGRLAIMQWPNVPLISWFVFGVLSRLLHAGHGRTITQDISKVALIVWAALEVYSGASYFRRALGLIVLVFTIISLWK